MEIEKKKKIFQEQGYKYPYTKFTSMYFQLLGEQYYNLGCIVSLDNFYRPHGVDIMDRKILPEIWGDDKAGAA